MTRKTVTATGQVIMLVRDHVGDTRRSGNATIAYTLLNDPPKHRAMLRTTLMTAVGEYLCRPTLTALAEIHGIVQSLALIELGVSWATVAGHSLVQSDHHEGADELRRSLGTRAVDYVTTPTVANLARVYDMLAPLAYADLDVDLGALRTEARNLSVRQGDYNNGVVMVARTAAQTATATEEA